MDSCSQDKTQFYFYFLGLLSWKKCISFCNTPFSFHYTMWDQYLGDIRYFPAHLHSEILLLVVVLISNDVRDRRQGI